MTGADLRFALLNLIPAVLYGGFILVSFSMTGMAMAPAWGLAGGLAAGMWLITGLLRTIALRRDWFSRGAGALLLRLSACVAVGAFALQFAVRMVVEAGEAAGFYRLPAGDIYGMRQMLFYTVQVALVLWLWVAAWAGTHLLRHRRHSEMARLRAESQRNALELDALRARLNPHFVFNALNNVRALINEEPARAREVVTQLSNILRHALEHSQRESASLGEELAVVDDYLAVESVHYDERLRVRRDIIRDTLDAHLPPMLLQLLVENAIRHGIARTPGGGELTIRARRHGNGLTIEVSNPGRLDSTGGGHGVGLAYLRTRLAREPGSRFELRQDNGQVCARLELAQ